jgi:hypothetical protein
VASIDGNVEKIAGHHGDDYLTIIERDIEEIATQKLRDAAATDLFRKPVWLPFSHDTPCFK